MRHAGRVLSALALTLVLLPALPARAEPAPRRARLKDIGHVQGVRSNQLFGLGLIVGLSGTGDSQQAKFTPRALSSMLQRLGMTVDAETIRTQNVATVMVTADLPAFVKPGDRIDVTISSVGDAKSLQGGLLVQTPLQGADSEVYAVAQGPVTIGGYNFGGGGGGGAKVQVNHPTMGRIPNGAIVERAVVMEMLKGQAITVALAQADFTTAAKAAEAINQAMPQAVARAIDGSSIQVQLPKDAEFELVNLIAKIETVEVEVDSVAKIIINERTGTVVLGGNVRISPVAIAHANLSVQITSTPIISQPPPLSSGQTVATAKTQVKVDEGKSRIIPLEGGATIDDVISSLNAIGATPRDMIAILQAMKQAGAILADIEMQ